MKHPLAVAAANADWTAYAPYDLVSNRLPNDSCIKYAAKALAFDALLPPLAIISSALLNPGSRVTLGLT